MSMLQVSTNQQNIQEKKNSFVSGKRKEENNTSIKYKGDSLTTQMFKSLMENKGTG